MPPGDRFQYEVSLTCPRYKPVGRNVGGIKGQRDGFESYGVGIHSK